jgi:hypothetical protein
LDHRRRKGHRIKEDEMGGASSSQREVRDAYNTLVGKQEGKRLLGRPRHRRQDNTRIDLRKIILGGVD